MVKQDRVAFFNADALNGIYWENLGKIYFTKTNIGKIQHKAQKELSSQAYKILQLQIFLQLCYNVILNVKWHYTLVKIIGEC